MVLIHPGTKFEIVDKEWVNFPNEAYPKKIVAKLEGDNFELEYKSLLITKEIIKPKRKYLKNLENHSI